MVTRCLSIEEVELKLRATRATAGHPSDRVAACGKAFVSGRSHQWDFLGVAGLTKAGERGRQGARVGRASSSFASDDTVRL